MHLKKISKYIWRLIMELKVGLNNEKNIMKMENPCTGTFLLLNKKEAIKLKKDLNILIKLMF
jgi:hypothetical protein